MKFILKKFSLLEYAGETSAIVFTYGCNLRCPYCYNLDCYFQRGTAQTKGEGRILNFLMERKGKLSAVVFSGGEPTLHPEALELCKKVKDLGFKTKLFTNGTRPEALTKWIPYLNAVDMSIKTLPGKYPLIGDSGRGIKASIEVIKLNFVDYHFSVVVFPYLCTNKETIDGIIELVGDLTVLQKRLTFIEPKLDVPVLMDEVEYSGLPWGKDYKSCLKGKQNDSSP